MFKWSNLIQMIKDCGDKEIHRYRAYGTGPCTVWQEGTIHMAHAVERGRFSCLQVDAQVIRFAQIDEKIDPIAWNLIQRLKEEHVSFTCTPTYDEERDMIQYRFVIEGVIMDAEN